MGEHQEKLETKGYKLLGDHGAVSLCHWTKKSITENRTCYKQKFYGINSHRCLQMTPSIFCQQKCVFCWRPQTLSKTIPEDIDWLEPKELIEKALKAQKKLLEGYYGMLDDLNEQKLDQAQEPNQVAISLTGEPTIYPYMSELIKEFKKKDFTTFLVTNGLKPDLLENMELPTQLYVSLEAFSEELHKRINIPFEENSWQKIQRTLELLSELDTRTVIRTTLLKDWNMEEPEKFVPLFEKASPNFIELKAYMFIGSSRQRLSIGNMPRHYEVKEFAEEIVPELSEYEIEDEDSQSRVVLLRKEGAERKIQTPSGS